MKGSGQSTPAELVFDVPILASSRDVEAGTDEIEAVVMTLFEQYRAPLLRYAVSFGIPVPDAEEIVQEVFLSLFRHLRLGRSRENLRGWIFRVAHNLTLKCRYANKRQLDLVENDEGLANLSMDFSSNPEETCLLTERHKRLLSVFQSLPETEKSCLQLRAEGLRYREIAGVLGISLGSVSAFLARSIAKLISVDRK